MQSHSLVCCFVFFFADKHSEVEIPGTVGLPTVSRNGFTKNTRILNAIKIYSSQAVRTSKAIFVYWDGGLDSFNILKFTTQALGTKVLVLKLEQASLKFEGSIKKMAKIVSSVTSRNGHGLLEVPRKRKCISLFTESLPTAW